jgi:hypothetical protein
VPRGIYEVKIKEKIDSEMSSLLDVTCCVKPREPCRFIHVVLFIPQQPIPKHKRTNCTSHNDKRP